MDVAVDIAAVIKNHAAQSLFQRNRETNLRIQYREHVTADWNADQGACRGIRWVRANQDGALRTRTVNWESTKRIGTAREEAFTERDIAVGKGRFQTQPEVFGNGEQRLTREEQAFLPKKPIKLLLEPSAVGTTPNAIV